MTLILSGSDGVSDIDGDASTPAIRGTDANTGIFFGADIIGFSEGGTECARFNADAQFVAAAGTASLPVITTTGDTNTGIFFPAADTIAFAEGGAEAMRIDSSGYVQINTTTADAVLSIHTDGTNTAKGYGVALVNDAGGGNTWTLQCGQYAVNNGAFTIYDKTNNKYAFKIESSTNYVTAQGIYDLTSGSAANVYVDSNGALYRSTSSLKYKTNIQNTSHGLAEVLQLRPVTYKGKNDGDKVFGGLIAEEVDKIGLKEFVEYADDGSPDSLAYGNMVSLLAKAIQEQQTIIDSLKARIEALENNNV